METNEKKIYVLCDGKGIVRGNTFDMEPISLIHLTETDLYLSLDEPVIRPITVESTEDILRKHWEQCDTMMLRLQKCIIKTLEGESDSVYCHPDSNIWRIVPYGKFVGATKSDFASALSSLVQSIAEVGE